MLTRIKKIWLPRFASYIPLDLWRRVVDVDWVLPHWHGASDADLPHISGLYRLRSLREFKADLDFFLQAYTPVSLQDLIRHLDGDYRLPKRCFLPTFDDGFREIYDLVAPLLYEKGVPSVFFPITAAIDNRELCYPQKMSLLVHALHGQHGSAAERECSEILDREGVEGSSVARRISSIPYCQREALDELGTVLGCDFLAYARSVQPYLTSSQISELMRMGFAIGAHSVNHPLYSEETLGEQLLETHQSMDWLSERFGFECQAFALPYRDLGVSHEFFAEVFNHGNLKISFGMDGLRRHYCPRHLNRFSMERTDLPALQILARQYGRALCYGR